MERQEQGLEAGEGPAWLAAAGRGDGWVRALSLAALPGPLQRTAVSSSKLQGVLSADSPQLQVHLQVGSAAESILSEATPY